MSKFIRYLFFLFLLVAVPQVLAQPVGASNVTNNQNSQTSITLNQVINKFLQKNLTLEAARYRVDIARAEQIAASLRPNPSIEVSVQNLKTNGETPFNQLYEAYAIYSQTIEMGSKRRLRREVADLGVSVAEAQLADILRQQLFQIKQAYYQVLLANATLEDAFKNRDNFNQVLKVSESRFEEGAIAEGELLKIRLEKVKFDSNIAQAQLTQQQSGIKLLELLGESDFSQTQLITGDLSFIPLTLSLSSLKESALANRPDLLLAQQSSKLAGRRIDLERARNTTDITPFAGFKRVGVNNTVLFGVTVPLRINNQNQAAIARSIAEEKIAQTEETIVRNRVLAEVESAYLAYETAKSQVKTFQNNLIPKSEESLSITLIAYKEGATDLLPLLEAERTKTEVRYQYVRSLYEYQLSILRLESAIAGELNP
jgi:outer membrane protein, heavy metal efflux system